MLLQSIARDRRGTSVLELGLALPVLMIIIMGIIDVSRLHLSQISLQQAAARSLERVQVYGMQSDYAAVRAEAAAAARVDPAYVTIDSWLECGSPPVRSTAAYCAGTTVSSRYLQVTIVSSYSPFFTYSPVGARQADGSVALSAASVIRVN